MKLQNITEKVLTNEAEKIRWIDRLRLDSYTINPTSGVVDVVGSVEISRYYPHLSHFPVQFGTILGRFDCSNLLLNSLRGCPRRVDGGFSCSGNPKLTSLNYAPEYVNGNFYCYDTGITSLTGIDKTIKEIHGGFLGNDTATHLLGLILITGITSVKIHPKVNDVINKYLGTGDILSCQDELLEMGLVQQAKL